MLTKKSIAASKAYAKNTDPLDLARANVVGGQDFHPGPYRALPVLGYLNRSPEGVLAVQLSCLLLRVYDNAQVASLGWYLPVNERTEHLTCRFLTSLGWDGRIWPIDPGWPDGADEETVGLKRLLSDSKLFATFIFPPVPEGSRVLRVDVLKTSGTFPLSPECPDEDMIEPTEEILVKFRSLLAEPELFLKGEN